MGSLNELRNSFVRYWQILWRGIITTFAGLRVTLKYLFSRPVTVEYPDALPDVPDGWRGWHAYETDRCILCRMCEKVCPIQCITIEAEGKGKTAKLLRYEIDYGMCLFCNLCVEVCPVLCLWMTRDWDLACYRREDCNIRFHEHNPGEERNKLWPSLVNHPLRHKKKTESEGSGATTSAKLKSEGGMTKSEESPA
jgi:NADH-quinone oxidoreductase subunit I